MGHLFMKQLLQREAEAQKAEGGATKANDQASGAPWFADALLRQAGGELSAWACKNRGGFVVAALDGVPSASAGVRKVLGAKAAKARLVKDAKAGGSMGAKVCFLFRVARKHGAPEVCRGDGALAGWLFYVYLLKGCCLWLLT